MKATDLMIGDWVCFDGDTSHKCPVQIDGISKEGAGVDGDWYDIWEPIPLTPEILEKNGWELTKIASSKHYWHDDIPFHIPIEPYHHWRGDEDKIFADDFFDSVFIRLDYVHELQHALKLCGIEKEIIL